MGQNNLMKSHSIVYGLLFSFLLLMNTDIPSKIKIISATLFCLGSAIVSLKNYKKLLIVNKINLLILMYALIGFVSVFYSSNKIYSFYLITIYFFIIIISILLTKYNNLQIANIFFKIISVYLLINLLFLFNSNSWIQPLGDVVRYKGIYVHPVAFSTLMLLYITIGSFLADKKENNFYYIFIVIAIVLILLTRSRSSILILFIMLSYKVYLNSDKFFRNNKIILITAAVTLVSGFAIIFGNYIVDFILRGTDAQDLILLTGRIHMWEVALDYLQNNPLRPKGFGLSGELLYENNVYKSEAENGVSHLHNAILQAGVQATIISAFIFFTLYVIMLKKLITIYQISDKSVRFFTFALSIILIVNMTVSVGLSMGRDLTALIFMYTINK